MFPQEQEEHIRGLAKQEIDYFKNSILLREYLQRARYRLTTAQILALNTTPITIVPAYLLSLIIVEGITAKNNFNTTAYTGGNNLEFRYTGAAGAKVTADMASTFINSSATAYDHVAGVVTELTPVINTPIVVRVPTANPATGDGSIDLFIKYRVVTF